MAKQWVIGAGAGASTRLFTDRNAPIVQMAGWCLPDIARRALRRRVAGA